MDIKKHIIKFLHHPFPLWDEEVTQLLIDNKWQEFSKQNIINQTDYNITACVLQKKNITEITYPIFETNKSFRIALPSISLSPFYEKHGLVPEKLNPQNTEVFEKIKSALNLMQNVKPIHSFILQIVKSIQIIKAEHTETDISYSHPDIPFSIFFSICEEVSTISDLRVAESILHESMHLLLTLIENHIDLIFIDSKATFYSPWRNEQRPLRGVLHGMFVFKAVKDFFTLLLQYFPKSTEEESYIISRITEIQKELKLLVNFPHLNDLTDFGKLLSYKLLSNDR